MRARDESERVGVGMAIRSALDAIAMTWMGLAQPRPPRMEACMERSPHRHGRLELSFSAPGAWTGIVYPARQGRIWRGAKFDELAWYAEHFDTVEVNSSFYRVPSPETTRKWAARTPRGLRVLGEAVSEAHPSGDVPRSPHAIAGGRRRGEHGPRFAGPHDVARDGGADLAAPTSTSSSARSIRWRAPASSARCSRSFRRASRPTPRRSTISRGCSTRSAITASRSSCAIAAGATSWRSTLEVLNAVEGGVGADRRAEVPARRSRRTSCRT